MKGFTLAQAQLFDLFRKRTFHAYGSPLVTHAKCAANRPLSTPDDGKWCEISQVPRCFSNYAVQADRIILATVTI
jgi:hypothetical protein